MNKKSVLVTLSYFDQYDFPLTEEELEKWEINDKNYPAKRDPAPRDKNYKHYNGYYFLEGRKKIIAIRKKRVEESQTKWQKARRATNLLKLIPTIQFVGVSGSLAPNNVSVNDDIDFFIVTKANWLWTTRFFVNLLLDLLGLRRHPGDKGVVCRDKVCLNMWCDESNLTVTTAFQNLHFAVDLLLLKSVFDRGGIKEELFSANLWAKKFVKMENNEYNDYNNYPAKRDLAPRDKQNFLEKFLFEFQIWWMEREETRRPARGRASLVDPHHAWFWIK